MSDTPEMVGAVPPLRTLKGPWRITVAGAGLHGPQLVLDGEPGEAETSFLREDITIECTRSTATPFATGPFADALMRAERRWARNRKKARRRRIRAGGGQA